MKKVLFSMKVQFLSTIVLLSTVSMLRAQIAYHPYHFATSTTTNWYKDYVGERLLVTFPPLISGEKSYTTANNGSGVVGTWGGFYPIIAPSDTLINYTADSCVISGTIGISMTGKVALLYRGGGIQFSQKALAAQTAGAYACIIVNNADGGAVGMATGSYGGSVTIPVFMVSKADGDAINAQLHAGVPVTINELNWGAGFTNDIGFVPEGISRFHAGAIPFSQLTAGINSYAYYGMDGAYIANYGSSDAANVKLATTTSFTPTGGSPSVIHKDSVILSSFPETDSIWSIYAAHHNLSGVTSTGKVDVAYHLSSSAVDQYTFDNDKAYSFYTTSNVFCKGRYDINNNQPFTTTYTGAGLNSGGTYNPYIWGPTYYVAKRTQATSVQFSLVTASTAGLIYLIPNQTLNVYLFKWVDGGVALDGIMQNAELQLVGLASKTFNGTTDSIFKTYTVNVTDTLGNPATIILDSNSWYWVAAEMPQTGTVAWSLGCDGVEDGFPRFVGNALDSNTEYYAPLWSGGDRATSMLAYPSYDLSVVPFAGSYSVLAYDSTIYNNEKGLIPNIALMVTDLPSTPSPTDRWYSYADYISSTWGGGNFGVSSLYLWKDTTATFGYSDGSYSLNKMTSIGMSFAPFLPAFNDSTLYPYEIGVTTSNAYTVDSIRIYGSYLRNNSTPTKIAVKDTLRCAFVYGDGTGSTNLPAYYFSDMGSISNFPYPQYGIDTLTFIEMMHDSLNDCAGMIGGFTTPSPYIVNIILSSTDSSSNFSRAFPVTFPVPAGNFTSVSVTFISGDTHPFGDTVTFATGAHKYNEFAPAIVYRTDGGSTVVFPAYNQNDQDVGYFKREGYVDAFWSGFYVPNWAFSSGAGASYLQYPYINFHVACPTCGLTSGEPAAVAFYGGRTQTFSVCQNSVHDSLNTLLAVTDLTAGQTLIWSVINPALHGALVASGSATSTGDVLVPYGFYYTPLTGYTGMDSFRVSVTNGTITDTTTIYVTVNPLPTTSTITGLSYVCQGATITLHDASVGGLWASSNASIATIDSMGMVTGIAAGSATITYTVTNVCGTAMATKNITVNPFTAGVITGGSSSICIGGTTTFSDVVTGGLWQSSNTAIATIGITNGIVNGVAAGAVTISYTETGACGTVAAITTINITATATAGTITGASTVSQGFTIVLADAVTGGAWSSSNTAVATIGASTGLVTGIAAGTATITYTVTSACGTATTTRSITVTAAVAPDRWYSYTDYTTSFWGSAYTGNAFLNLWNDTTARFGNGGSYYFNEWTSIGLSFDPFFPGFNDSTLYPHDIVVTDTNLYTIDSIRIIGEYMRNAATPTKRAIKDTLRCAFVYGDGTSVTNLPAYQFNDGGSTSNFPYPYYGVDTLTFIQMMHDSLHNRAGMNTGVLTAPYIVDIILSNTDTSSNFSKAYPVSYPVPRGNFASVSVSFISGDTHPFGDTVTYTSGVQKYNEFMPKIVYHSDGLGGAVFPYYNIDDQNVGYFKREGYSDAGWAGFYIPNWAWTSGIGAAALQYPDIAFHVSCPTCGNTTGENGPAFVGGPTQTMTVCENTLHDSIATYLTATDPHVGQTLIWGIVHNAAHGTLVASGSGTSTGLPVSPTGVYYTPNTGYAGLDSFRIRVTNGVVSDTTTIHVIINPLPSTGTITAGSTSLCIGSSATFTDSVLGGYWHSSSATVANIDSFSGITNALASGVTTISYTISNACGVATATSLMSVTSVATAGFITGASHVCQGATISMTDGVAGGVWNSSNIAVATIGTTTGLIYGVAPGAVTISYTVTSSCGTATTTRTITVNTLPVAGTITGASTVCQGAVITLSDVTLGGTWGTADSTIAIVTGGAVTGVGAGTTTIFYNATNACGVTSATTVISVNPAPNAGTIVGGSTSICLGTATTFADSASGGTWHSSNPLVASISSTGIVNGLLAGSSVISYTVSNSCGVARATLTINISASASAGGITGAATVCQGATVTLADGVPGGTWHSSNTAIASIGASTGLLSGIANGVATISYTVSSTCGLATTTSTITVNSVPSAGTILGLSSVCQSSILSLVDGVSGGVWSSSNTAVAAVSSGVVTGVSAGIAVISYTLTNSCGYAAATQTITVNAIPSIGTLSGGSSNICTATTTTFTDAYAGGVWSSSNTSIATIGASTGIVTGVGAGVAVVSYTITNSCGFASATTVINVTTVASAGTITGVSNICAGLSTTLTDGVLGGSWSCSNAAIANVDNTTGIVTGISAGTAIITYTDTTTCGVATATHIISVNTYPTVGVISGSSTVCRSSSISLSDATTGGTWHSSNTSIANVSSTTGVVGGSTAGTATISYTVSNICGAAIATTDITVIAAPSSISGIVHVCQGSLDSLFNSATGGTWTSSDSTKAIVYPGGLVSGLSPGSVVISYSTGCGTAVGTTFTVLALPFAGTISVAPSICQGALTVLTTTGTSGVFSTTNGDAFVSAGVVTGVSAGIDTIFYAVSTPFCGTALASAIITVNAIPVMGTLTGQDSVCTGSATSIIASASGGIWRLTNANATDSAGIVTGVSVGFDTLYYTISTPYCGSDSAWTKITVLTLPTNSAITGATWVCVGAMDTLSDSTSGGTWLRTDTIPASVSNRGVVTGLVAGVDTIIYLKYNFCGFVPMSIAITVNPLPFAGTITGISNICIGDTTHFMDSTVGGIWSAQNGNATFAGGIVAGVAAGADSIFYSVTNICGTATVAKQISVNTVPAIDSITGVPALCLSTSSTLADSIAGGVWSAINTNVSVSAGGMITANAVGIDTVTYTLTNSCGSSVTKKQVMVITVPYISGITGPSSICLGAVATLFDSSTGGIGAGSWVAHNANATIGATGITTGMMIGIDTIAYTDSNVCGKVDTTYPINIIDTLPVINRTVYTLSVTPGFVTYQWYKNSTMIAGATNATYITSATDTGSFMVDVTNSLGCNGTSAMIQFHGLSVNNINVVADDIRIFPNPTEYKVFIDAPIAVDAQLSTIDGRMVADVKNAKEIDLGNLPNGIYFITIYDNETGLKIKADRIVKESK